MSSDGPLQPEFQSRIDALLSHPNMKGAYVYSGYRNNAHQAGLFAKALKKYGSVQAARHNVAPEGHSNHNHGIAADIGFTNNSQRYWLKKAQESGELAKMGLQLRMSHEGWHVEPLNATGDHADFFGTGKDPVFSDTSLPQERVQKWGPHRSNGPINMNIATLPDVNVTATRPNYDDLIQKYAAEYGVPLHYARNMMGAESSGNPNAKSNKGAMGLMQLMPDTAKQYGVTDPFDPEQNIRAGLRYFRDMYDQQGDWSRAAAAYNWGPGNLEKYGYNGMPRETQNYVNKVVQNESSVQSPYPSNPLGVAQPVGMMAKGIDHPLIQAAERAKAAEFKPEQNTPKATNPVTAPKAEHIPDVFQNVRGKTAQELIKGIFDPNQPWLDKVQAAGMLRQGMLNSNPMELPSTTGHADYGMEAGLSQRDKYQDMSQAGFGINSIIAMLNNLSNLNRR